MFQKHCRIQPKYLGDIPYDYIEDPQYPACIVHSQLPTYCFKKLYIEGHILFTF